MSYAYLAHPIDQSGTHRTRLVTDAEIAKKLFADHGIDTYHPAGAWHVAPQTPAHPYLQKTNYFAMHHASMMLVLWPAGIPTYGTGIELGEWLTTNRPAAIVTDNDSYALAAHPNLHVTDNIEHAIELLLHDLNEQPNEPTARYYGNGHAPTKAYDDDAGFDLYSDLDHDINIMPGQCVDIPAGVSVQFPRHMWGLLVGRSSTFRTHGLMVNPGIIDTGYRGPLFAVTRNISNYTVTVRPGDRIAQIIPMNTEAYGLKMTQAALDPSERGTNGFGSSGR